MELLHMHLFSQRSVAVRSCCGFLKLLKLCKITLLLPQFHPISGCQLTLIFLLELVHSSWLDTLWSSQGEVSVHAALILHEPHHVHLDEGHSQNIDHLWSLSLIFSEHLRDQIFQFLRVHIRNRPLLVLDNLEDKTKEVLS